MKNFYSVYLENKEVEFNEYEKLESFSDENVVIKWREDYQKADSLIFKEMTYKELKSVLEKKSFSVVKKDDLYYRTLNGQVSSFEFGSKIDAYMDCFLYAYEKEMI